MTAKGVGARLANSAIRDLWMPTLQFLLLTISIAVGFWQLLVAPTLLSPLAISLLWAIYNAIPPYLIIHYTWIGRVRPTFFTATLKTADLPTVLA